MPTKSCFCFLARLNILYIVIICHLELTKGHVEDIVQQEASANNVLISESDRSDIIASPTPTRKNLRPRLSKKDTQDTPQPKSKSKKRNIFTEDETSPGDEEKDK